jgi:hypothetical protein
VLAPVLAAVALIASGSATGDGASPSINLSKPLPSVIRIDQLLRIAGQMRHSNGDTTAMLQIKRSTKWKVVASAGLGTDRSFRLRWRVTGKPYSQIQMRVVAEKDQNFVASTPARKVAVGPRAVYCVAATPPGNVPRGDGWIEGGLYGEGGPYPGMYACSSQPYTVTATKRSGKAPARQQVAARHSYTLVVPAGKYTLTSGACSGTASVQAGRLTRANTYCRYP